jgi:hypothetical protein
LVLQTLVELTVAAAAATKAAPAAVGVDRMATDSSPTVATLRSELAPMKLSALQKRALADGVDSDALEEALDDGDNPKEAVIALLLQKYASAQSPADATDAARLERLREKLDLMKLSALQKRALADGVDSDALEEALDDDNSPKEAVIALLLQKYASAQSSTGATDAALIEQLLALTAEEQSDRPHFGSKKTDAAPPPAASSTKHVMLSYQWGHQTRVKRAHDMLTKLGVRCWMDITGGMGADIFDSMAEGVSNASVVVCFMSQAYQDSENCMLELKFAKQSGVPLVPVMVEGSGWRPSAWLGLLTAGALWTPLTDPATFDENVRQLQGQIEKVTGVAEHEEVSSDEAVASSSEAKEELERLRDDLAPRSVSASAAVLADPLQPATLPAGVPKLPAKFQTTEQIAELTRLVLSTTAADMSMPRVGFHGMGGASKIKNIVVDALCP